MPRSISRSRIRPKSAAKGGRLWQAMGVCLIALALSVVGGGVYVWANAKSRPTLDKTTLCPVEGPYAMSVVLLDASDPLPDVTQREALTYLLDIADAVPEFGLLEVRKLVPGYPARQVVFSKCNPGDGSALSETTGNPKLAKKRWRDGFRAPLEQELKGGLVGAPASSSPILATLQAIAVEKFTGDKAGAVEKNLTVISDFIEHSPGYSQYQGDLSYERFKRSETFKRVRTNLNGAAVRLLYVQRLGRRPLNSADHLKFWMDWVQDSSGRFVEAKKLQGAS